MKRYLIAAALIGAAVAVPSPASAAVDCVSGPVGWTVNADEGDRMPTPTPAGLKFEGNDLIHHATTGTVETLTPGSFAAAPAPDQDSFFSVEVYGTDGGYGTLRWNTTTHKWNLTTGGQFYENADPAALVDMPTVHRSHKVVSFGVGYTANPPGTVATVVSSVTFAEKTYSLGCTKPTVSPSPTVTPTKVPTKVPTTKPTVTPTRPTPPTAPTSVDPSSSPAPVAGGLPVTGPPIYLIAIWAVGFLAMGGVLLLAVRRSRPRFDA